MEYLSTKVKYPNTDDKNKLRRMMVYIVATKDLVLWLKVGHLDVLKWPIDATYAIHYDMKGRTRESLSMGVGKLHAKSVKQILNVKISTKS